LLGHSPPTGSSLICLTADEPGKLVWRCSGLSPRLLVGLALSFAPASKRPLPPGSPTPIPPPPASQAVLVGSTGVWVCPAPAHAQVAPAALFTHVLPVSSMFPPPPSALFQSFFLNFLFPRTTSNLPGPSARTYFVPPLSILINHHHFQLSSARTLLA
jgi:hypothetical protein